MPNIVGERYQITIDKEIRELGIKPGDRAIERVENGRLVVDSFLDHTGAHYSVR